jgi:hypothetical protein
MGPTISRPGTEIAGTSGVETWFPIVLHPMVFAVVVGTEIS